MYFSPDQLSTKLWTESMESERLLTGDCMIELTNKIGIGAESPYN